jgi:uncharacterized protein RhaS with RHS repeats
MYDPVSGRFISEDPIGLASGDTNPYRYCGNSPTNFTDPTGLIWGWGAAGIGATIGVVGYTVGTGVSSIWSGENQFTAGGFVGAAAGGAVAGLIIGAVTGDVTSAAGLLAVGAAAGGAAGLTSGVVGTLADQTIDTVTTGRSQYDASAVLLNGGIGLVGGALGGAVAGMVLGPSVGTVGAGLGRTLFAGAAGGAAAGAVSGGAHAYSNNEDIFYGAARGALVGSASGVAMAGTASAIPGSFYARAIRNLPLRGTNARGEVTSRAGLRQEPIREAWNRAPRGPNNGRICRDCGREVTSRGRGNDQGQMDHYPAWTNRQFSRATTRGPVRDNAQQGLRMRCGLCNRARGNNDALVPRWAFPFPFQGPDEDQQ